MKKDGRILKVSGIKKHIGKLDLGPLSFELKPGVITGLIGVNGSGKTTLLRTMMGSYIRDEGKLSYVDSQGNEEVIEDFKDELSFVLADFPYHRGLAASSIGKVYGKYYDSFDYSKYMGLLKEYGVNEKGNYKILSKGECIKMQTAFALSYPSSIYVFDEPVGNLDPEFRDKFYDIMRDIVSDEKSSIIISSHLVMELEKIADELVWIKNEKIYFYGTVDELKDKYRIIDINKEELQYINNDMIVGSKIRDNHSEVMITIDNLEEFEKIKERFRDKVRFAELQEIMYFVEKGMEA